jgi:hypothetical protein
MARLRFVTMASATRGATAHLVFLWCIESQCRADCLRARVK